MGFHQPGAQCARLGGQIIGRIGCNPAERGKSRRAVERQALAQGLPAQVIAARTGQRRQDGRGILAAHPAKQGHHHLVAAFMPVSARPMHQPAGGEVVLAGRTGPWGNPGEAESEKTVSYTHLTLPTIYSV